MPSRTIAISTSRIWAKRRWRNEKEKRRNYFSKLEKCKKCLKKFNSDLQTFEKYLNNLKINKINIKEEDEKRIALFYQPGYIEHYIQFNLKNKNILNDIKNLSFGPDYYNKYGIENLNKNTCTIENFINELKKEKGLLRDDVKIIKKYLNTFFIISNNLRNFINYLSN
jgi:uncharacterized protein (UPF0305 family)